MTPCCLLISADDRPRVTGEPALTSGRRVVRPNNHKKLCAHAGRSHRVGSPNETGCRNPRHPFRGESSRANATGSRSAAWARPLVASQRRRMGRVAAAGSGTLFLSVVADSPESKLRAEVFYEGFENGALQIMTQRNFQSMRRLHPPRSSGHIVQAPGVTSRHHPASVDEVT